MENAIYFFRHKKQLGFPLCFFQLMQTIPPCGRRVDINRLVMIMI